MKVLLVAQYLMTQSPYDAQTLLVVIENGTANGAKYFKWYIKPTISVIREKKYW
jgi:hypothetical protein